MKEFIEKLISKLEEEKQACHINAEVYTERKIGKIIEIINELAEEYKGGWIPFTQRELTEEEKSIIANVTICLIANFPKKMRKYLLHINSKMSFM